MSATASVSTARKEPRLCNIMSSCKVEFSSQYNLKKIIFFRVLTFTSFLWIVVFKMQKFNKHALFSDLAGDN